MPICPVCRRMYKKKGNLKNHIKTKHPETLAPAQTTEEKQQKVVSTGSEFQTTGDEKADFSSDSGSWDIDYKEFDEWLSSVDAQPRDESDMLQQQKMALTVTVEQVYNLYVVVNEILDALVDALGGETPCYSAMSKETLEVLASTTKTTMDMYGVQVSPLTALFITITLAYATPTMKALRSISKNRRKKKRQQKVTSEATEEGDTFPSVTPPIT